MFHRFFYNDANECKIEPLKPWQKKRFIISVITVIIIGTLYLSYTCSALLADKHAMRETWNKRLSMSDELKAEADTRSAAATTVYCGTYFENFKELSLNNSSFRAGIQAWFRWEGDPAIDMMNHFRFYKGTINSKEVLAESHENGVHYQLVQLDVTINKDFYTNRFPLDSHQLNLYLESEYPIEHVRLRADTDNSSINGSMGINGYNITNHYVSEYVYRYDSTHGDPALDAPIMTSEVVTSLEMTRNGFGMYMKCFIALFGTSLWVFITLFICTNHHVDPLEMIPEALFGSVGNIMIGASLLPDALSLGLLEYVNIWGIMTVIAGALYIISVNRIRNKYQDQNYAYFFGRTMFVLLLLFVVAGHILMPVCAYL
ncbi:MAG: hypothetical protein RR821_10655 [Clostridia bacterium]